MSHANWQQERRSLARERILDAAAALFAEHGVVAAKMADIAERAGCGRATLYRYFPSREELLDAYIGREARRIADELREHAAQCANLSDRLVEAMLYALHTLRTDPAVTPFFASDAMGETARVAGASGPLHQEVGGLLRDLLRPGGDERLRRGLDLQEVGEWLVRVVLSLATVPPSRPRSRAEEARFLRDFAVSGLVERE